MGVKSNVNDDDEDDDDTRQREVLFVVSFAHERFLRCSTHLRAHHTQKNS